MKSLIIGANGMLGTALSRQLPNAIKTVRLPDPVPTRFEIYADITKYESLFSIFSNYRPELVFLTAYNTDVEKCESEETDATNIRGATTVLRLCEQFESKLIFFSSSYVFDGESKYPYDILEQTNPVNRYGFQKDFVEKKIITSDLNEFVIIRTVSVFGPDLSRKNFVNQIEDNVTLEKKVFVPDDQYVNPVYSGDLARLAIHLAKHERGLFHVAGDTCLTKHEWAVKVASYFGYEKYVVPLSSKDMRQMAKRPKMGCLDCHELEVVGQGIPSFKAGLDLFLDSEVAL